MNSIFNLESVIINIFDDDYECPRWCLWCSNSKNKGKFVWNDMLISLDNYLYENFPNIKKIHILLDIFNNEHYNIFNFLISNTKNKEITFDIRWDLWKLDKGNLYIKEIFKDKNVSIVFTLNLDKGLELNKKYMSNFLYLMKLTSKINSEITLDLVWGDSLSRRDKIQYFILAKKFCAYTQGINPNIIYERWFVSFDFKTMDFSQFNKNFYNGCYMLNQWPWLEVWINKIFFHWAYCKNININNFGDFRSEKQLIDKKANIFLSELGDVFNDYDKEKISCIECNKLFKMNESWKNMKKY